MVTVNNPATADTQTGVGQSTLPGNAAVQAAESQVGQPYVSGGRNPGGFDCSGLMQWSYLQGTPPINIGPTTDTQWSSSQMTTICDAFGAGAYGIPTMVDESQLELGDCIYFFSPGNSGNKAHVMMYVGGAQCIQAPYTGQVVGYTPLQFVSAASDEPFRGVRRVTGGGSSGVGANVQSGSGTGSGNNSSNNPDNLLTPQQIAQMKSILKNLKDPRSNLPFSAAFLGQAFGGQLGDFRFTGLSNKSVMPATQLVRGGIVDLITQEFKFYFMMNPSQISVDCGFNSQNYSPFQVSDYAQSGGQFISQQTVTFTVYCNRMYEVWQNNVPGPNGEGGPSAEGCRWDTRAVERLVGVYDAVVDKGGAVGLGNNGWGDYPATMFPVQVVIGGPNSIQFQGYMAQLDYTYTIFDANMIPVECYIDIGVMRVYNPTESGADLTSSLITSTGQVGPQNIGTNTPFSR